MTCLGRQTSVSDLYLVGHFWQLDVAVFFHHYSVVIKFAVKIFLYTYSKVVLGKKTYVQQGFSACKHNSDYCLQYLIFILRHQIFSLLGAGAGCLGIILKKIKSFQIWPFFFTQQWTEKKLWFKIYPLPDSVDFQVHFFYSGCWWKMIIFLAIVWKDFSTWT